MDVSSGVFAAIAGKRSNTPPTNSEPRSNLVDVCAAINQHEQPLIETIVMEVQFSVGV